jgi:hypothetical protein
LTELEVHYEDAEECILEEGMVEYNSFIDWKTHASANLDGD